jgi:hypothetical protein
MKSSRCNGYQESAALPPRLSDVPKRKWKFDTEKVQSKPEAAVKVAFSDFEQIRKARVRLIEVRRFLQLDIDGYL